MSKHAPEVEYSVGFWEVEATGEWTLNLRQTLTPVTRDARGNITRRYWEKHTTEEVFRVTLPSLAAAHAIQREMARIYRIMAEESVELRAKVAAMEAAS
jgi:hypothetical protein